MATTVVRPEVISATLSPKRIPRQILRHSPFGFGWFAASGAVVGVGTPTATADGSGSLNCYSSVSAPPTAAKTVTGLVVGQTYTITASVRAFTTFVGTWPARIAVAGFISGATVNVPNDAVTWVQATITFTATSTSHQVQLQSTYAGGASDVLWDNVKIVADPSGTIVMNDTFDWTDGWVGAPNAATASYARSTDGDRSSLLLSRPTSTTTVTGKRTFTGLTIGRSYSVHVAVNCNASSTSFTIGITGGTTSAPITLPTSVSVWQLVSHTFTATATSHEVVLSAANALSASMSVYADYVYFIEDARVDAAGTVPLKIEDGLVTLDRGWSPHVTAQVTASLDSTTLSHETDPRTALRLNLVTAAMAAGATVPPATDTTRTFNLGVRERRVDYKAKTVSLSLASDEAMLMDYANVSTAVDNTPRASAASLRAVTNWALGKIGASLSTVRTDDKDLTPYWPLTNLVPNPNCATSITGYFVASGATIAWNSGAGAISGNGFLRATMSSTFASVQWHASSASTDSYAVSPGEVYSMSCYVKNSAAAGQARITVRFYDSSGQPTGPSRPAAYTNLTTSFARISHSATVPAGAARMRVTTDFGSMTSGQLADADCFMLVQDTELSAYFDGATTGSATYIYAWADDTNASASTRTPVIDRPRELFSWTPGQTLWDFLDPLLDASGLRLYCDEARVWVLTNPDNSDGLITVVEKGVNMIDAADTISRNDDTWADSVVLLYRWTDRATGLQKEQYATAGTAGGRTYTRTYEDTPYPGPGAAAFVLARLSKRGRRSEVVRSTSIVAAAYNWRAWLYLTDEPYTNPLTADVTAVTFDLGRGTMSLTLETVVTPTSPPVLVLEEGPGAVPVLTEPEPSPGDPPG